MQISLDAAHFPPKKREDFTSQQREPMTIEHTVNGGELTLQCGTHTLLINVIFLNHVHF